MFTITSCLVEFMK